jgi:hypothetical protein
MSGTAVAGTAVAHADPGWHTVRFYRDTRELSAAVAGFLTEGLRAGEHAIIVATTAHRLAFAAALAAAGVDAPAARARGQLVVLDAPATLRLVQAAGQPPDPEAFRRIIGGLITRLAADGRPVRVYGEMVALLWDDGQLEAAIALESLWNELAATTPFALLCAYPSAGPATTPAQTRARDRVRELHSGVMASPLR